MGGRGAASGFPVGDKPYGSEYKTLGTMGNVKFVQRVEGSATAPLETATKNRVYVTVNSAGDLKFVSYYDQDNKRKKTIDLSHLHGGVVPHVHHGYTHNELDGPKGATGLSEKERRLVAKIKQAWYDIQHK